MDMVFPVSSVHNAHCKSSLVAKKWDAGYLPTALDNASPNFDLALFQHNQRPQNMALRLSRNAFGRSGLEMGSNFSLTKILTVSRCCATEIDPIFASFPCRVCAPHKLQIQLERTSRRSQDKSSVNYWCFTWKQPCFKSRYSFSWHWCLGCSYQ